MNNETPLPVEEVRSKITDEMARRDGYKDADTLRKALALGDWLVAGVAPRMTKMFKLITDFMPY